MSRLQAREAGGAVTADDVTAAFGGGTIEHAHTADTDTTDESCEGCKVLVEAANVAYAEQQERKAQRHVDRILKIAARFTKARDEIPNMIKLIPDPLILAAVIIADAIGDVEARLDKIEDRLIELRDAGERSR